MKKQQEQKKAFEAAMKIAAVLEDVENDDKINALRIAIAIAFPYNVDVSLKLGRDA